MRREKLGRDDRKSLFGRRNVSSRSRTGDVNSPPATIPGDDVSETFQTYTHHGRTGYAVADLPRDVLVRLVERPEVPLQTELPVTVKDGDGVLVCRTTLPLADRRLAIAYKRVHRKSLLKQLTQAVGPNRARRSFLTGHRLLERGIATARPLAVIVPSRVNLTAPTWLATEWLDGAEDLAAFARRSRQQTPQERDRVNAVAIAVGRLIGTMHAAGIAHRDLKPQNLMVRCGERPEAVELFAIDLDGVRFPGRLSEQRRWKNLSRLAIGDRGWPGLDQTVQYRFLGAYLDAAGLPISRHQAWRELSHVTAARLARRAA